MNRIYQYSIVFLITLCFLWVSIQVNKNSPVNNIRFFSLISDKSTDIKINPKLNEQLKLEISRAIEQGADSNLAMAFMNKLNSDSNFFYLFNEVLFINTPLDSRTIKKGGDFYIIETSVNAVNPINCNIVFKMKDGNLNLEELSCLEDLLINTSYAFK